MTDNSSREEPGDRISSDKDETSICFRDYAFEDYIVLAVFWILAGVVFAQFFSRYVLNSSITWTEEIARYLLIGVAFLGSVTAVRKRAHIYVEFFYRLLPKWAGKILSRAVDIITAVFFTAASILSIRIIPIMSRRRMVSLDIPLSVIYWAAAAGFTAMTLRSIQTAWKHWREGDIPVMEEGEET